MSLILPDGFPVVEDLCDEEIARELLCGKVEDASRTLRILIVNLMPVKRDAERDFLRLLVHSPYDISVDFLRMKSHISKNTPMKHVETFYKDFDGIAADGIDYALCIRTAENGLCHRSLPDGQMIRLTFLQAVLDGVSAFIAHGIAAHAVVLPKPMREPVFILDTGTAAALHA